MFESIMYQYIKEERDVLNRLLASSQFALVKDLKKYGSIYFVAHGSSYNAAYSIASLFQKYAKVRTYVYHPGDLIANISNWSLEGETLMVFISQTGTSKGVLDALKLVREHTKTLAISAFDDSPLCTGCDLSLNLMCDKENSNAKTKGYSATLLTLIMFAYHLALVKGELKKEQFDKIKSDIKKEIDSLPALFNTVLAKLKDSSYIEDIHDFYIVGNGLNYGTSQEAALKLTETLAIPAVFNDVLEFSHGVHRALCTKSHVLIIASSIYHEASVNTFEYLRNKNVPVFLIDNQARQDSEHIIALKYYQYTDSILSITLCIQVLSCLAPESIGLDPNRDLNDDYTDYMSTRVK